MITGTMFWTPCVQIIILNPELWTIEKTKGKSMCAFKLSSQGLKLIEQYETMAKEGFYRTDGSKVPAELAYNSFQLKKFKHICKDYFIKNKIKTVLDYGGGGSDWSANNFDSKNGISAKDFFKLSDVTTFEPARGLDYKINSDAVVCVDVLEHIFLGDIANIVSELFSLAQKLLVVNVACYKAAALLPNGENAHVTVRSPDWWKGTFDTVSSNYPNVQLLLICSTKFNQGVIYEPHKFNDWLLSESYEVQGKFAKFSLS